MEVSRQSIPEFTPNIQAAISKGHQLTCENLTVKIDNLKQVMGKSNIIAKLFDKIGISANAQALQSLQKQRSAHESLVKGPLVSVYTPAELRSAISTLNTTLSQIDKELTAIAEKLAKNLPDALRSALGNAPEDALTMRNDLLDKQASLRDQKNTVTEKKEALETTFNAFSLAQQISTIKAEIKSKMQQQNEADNIDIPKFIQLGDELRVLDQQLEQLQKPQ
jgi:hypothetical protein